MSWLSPLLHYLFVATCDFCNQELSGNDFNRICLRCVVQLENTQKVRVCRKCFQPLQKVTKPSFKINHSTLKPQLNNICGNCIDKTSSLLENRSLFFNSGLAQRLIYDFKFKPHSSYAPIVAYWTLKKLKNYLKSFDVFVPIPLGKKGLYEREFCQVTKVTQSLSHNIKIPWTKVIVRNERSYLSAQHGLSAKERETSVQEKYLYLPKFHHRFDNKRVLVIDDIYTTGSTLKNAADLFKKNNDNVEIASFTFLRTFL